MSSKSVYSNLDYVAKLPKETFPMTQQIEFSSVAGSLVPVFCDFLHPGEKISGHAEMFTRTRELQTAAFADIDEYIEYFFVPACKLNMIFGEWFFNIDDRSSVWRPATLPERGNVLPNVTYDRMLTYLDSVKAEDYSFIGSMSPSESLMRLLQHFRYDIYHLFDADGQDDIVSSNVWNFSLSVFQAYQAIYYDYYRDSLWENNDVEAYNTDDWLTSVSSADDWSVARLRKFFTIHQRRQNADYYTSIHPSPLQNATNMLNINGVREAALLQLNQWLDNAGISFNFGQSQFQAYNGNTNITLQSALNPSTVTQSILGDGSKIAETSTGKKTSYNEEYMSSGGNIDYEQAIKFLPTGPADEVGGIGATISGSSTNSSLYHKHPIPALDVNSVEGTVSGFSINSNINTVLGALKSSITSTSIRTMFALEKLAQITGRAGKHYDDQVLAHYGFKVSKSYGLESQMVGQQHSTVHIGEIVSPTSVPDGSVAGEIVGKGYGQMTGDKVVDFVAPCHGYFMAIYSAVPRRVYTPQGNPKEFSQLYRFDFVQPELMNLGQQPLFFSEFNLQRSSTAAPVAGWQWRYMEEKCRVPMAIGALSRFSETDSTENGALQDWTIQYPIFNLTPGVAAISPLAYNNLIVLPGSFNSIMLLQYASKTYTYFEGKVARFFDRDPLYHKLTMKLYKTSYMSKFGEPRID